MPAKVVGSRVMSWVFLLLALAALCLLAALGLLLAWVLGLMAQRVGSRSRDDSALLDPAELRRLREQAQARRAGTAADVAPPDGTLP
jgi:hypothetical protein